ncbi:MAG: hypothetical protein ACK5GU_10745 [Chloroflexota bacterium]|jgi:hypothetical protein
MATQTSHFIDIAPTQTHVVLLSHLHLVLQAERAHTLSIDGVLLQRVSGSTTMWQWHTHRRVGHHVMVIERDDDVQVVAIECVDSSAHGAFVRALSDGLFAIDARLCLGHSAWQTVGIQLSLFESLIGMTCEAFLRTILRLMHSSAPQALHEWQGETPAQLRVDRVVLRDSTIVPFTHKSAEPRNKHASISLLRQVIDGIAQSADYPHLELINMIRQRLLSPITVHTELTELIERANHALTLCRRSNLHGDMRQTADVALLYERWVWIVVLRALGCDATQIPHLINGNREYLSDAGIMCAYQRRLAPTEAMTGWSRDGRVAVPDVMLWQVCDATRCRSLIIDAKCALGRDAPDAVALNDVTAYMRRVGVGREDPDAAVLVHPGTVGQRWPSGLILIGTNGAEADSLVALVRSWGVGEI